MTILQHYAVVEPTSDRHWPRASGIRNSGWVKGGWFLVLIRVGYLVTMMRSQTFLTLLTTKKILSDVLILLDFYNFKEINNE